MSQEGVVKRGEIGDPQKFFAGFELSLQFIEMMEKKNHKKKKCGRGGDSSRM